MKIRKRMGLPKARLVPSGSVDATQSSVPPKITEILRDRVRRTIVHEQQLAATQRRLLELVSAHTLAPSPHEAQHKEPLEDVATTPEKLVAFLNRIAAR